MQSGQKLPPFQKAWLILGLALSALLAGCGGAGTKYNEFIPKRIVVIGDEISYVGCTVNAGVCTATDDNTRFTINNSEANVNVSNSSADNSLKLARYVNNWVLQLATDYGLPLSSIVESAYQKDMSTTRRASRIGAKLADITAQTQNQNIPDYATGDMLIIAGGTNDILDTLVNPPTGTVTLNATMAPYRASFLNKLSGGTGTLTDKQINQILNAAQGYLDLAKSMVAKGYRNVFIPAVYDFSNSPDMSSFCSGCDVTNAKQAVYLFDVAMKFDPTNQLQSSPGQPRVLYATGYASDALYVNITTPSTVNLNGYSVSKSACGASSSINVSVDRCVWMGTFSASASSVSSTSSGVTTTVAYDPALNTATETFSNNNSTVTLTGNFSKIDPDFLSTTPPGGSVQGGLIYARDLYLVPAAQRRVGDIFYTFMRGYYGW